MKTKTIELGDIAKDTVTGFKGVVVAETLWLHGCRRIMLQPQGLTKDGKAHESQSFDELQLELIKSGVVAVTSVKEPAAAPVTGGPRPDAHARPGAGKR